MTEHKLQLEMTGRNNYNSYCSMAGQYVMSCISVIFFPYISTILVHNKYYSINDKTFLVQLTSAIAALLHNLATFANELHLTITGCYLIACKAVIYILKLYIN